MAIDWLVYLIHEGNTLSEVKSVKSSTSKKPKPK
jgi:hypothetical protein